MTSQDQTPHFPCGPCPLEERIHKAIRQYFALSESLSATVEEATPERDTEAIMIMVSLVDGFLQLLHAMRLVAETRIDHFYLEEKG